MTEKVDPKQFDVMFQIGTTPDQFPAIVKPFLLPEEIIALGGSDDIATQKIADSLPFLGVMAPSPNTFDLGAFKYMCCSELTEPESDALLKLATRLGIFREETSPIPNLRIFSISESMVEKMHGLLIDE